MIYFVWNVLLALIWAAAATQFTLVNLAIGYVVAFFVLWYMSTLIGPTTYFRRVGQTIVFVPYFLWEMIKANLRVAYDVVTPKYYMQPGVVAVPLDAETDLEIALLSIVITLTPGTLALGISADRKTLYVHGMFIDDPEALRQDIKCGFERRLLEVLR